MNNRLFVGNLKYGATKDDVASLFGSGYHVTDIALPVDPTTQQSKGFAFVTLADEAEVEQAIAQLSGSTLQGRPLRVDRALERPGPGKPPDRHRPHDDRPRRRESW